MGSEPTMRSAASTKTRWCFVASRSPKTGSTKQVTRSKPFKMHPYHATNTTTILLRSRELSSQVVTEYRPVRQTTLRPTSRQRSIPMVEILPNSCQLHQIHGCIRLCPHTL
ncbi:hypothetical protein ElyMa_002758300 [Elysia marginata]|uniref:Uncharacterized protein n=1 Tax=Elysia marginata TaxID=1093978 RepID=A0AAV4HII8_9GAST|nr:hypothetical protein ElyMa_002758300 [Elysia marginata]